MDVRAKLPSKRAPGQDGITYDVIKHNAHPIGSPISTAQSMENPLFSTGKSVCFCHYTKARDRQNHHSYRAQSPYTTRKNTKLILQKSHCEIKHFDPEPFDDYDNLFTEAELLDVRAKLPSKRAPGQDGITYDVIKHNAHPIGSPISIAQSMENPLFSTGKSVCCCHYTKARDRQNHHSYRGIALIPTLLKIFTSLLFNRLKE